MTQTRRPPDPNPGPTPGPTSDLPTELRGLWHTRPVRTATDRKVAGVCAGFARRYGVDPLLVRVAFVVTALWGGGGVFLYALAWVGLRADGDEVSPAEALLGRGYCATSRGAAVVLAVVAFVCAPTIGLAGESVFLGSGLLLDLAMLAGWYGLYRRSPEPDAGRGDGPGDGTGTRREPDTRPGEPLPYAPGHRPGEPAPGTRTPPAWDPLGAAPFAWDLPEPGPGPEPVPPRRRSALTPVTLVLAVTTAVAAAVAGGPGGLEWFTTARVCALALAVLGGGLLVGAARCRGHMLLVVAGPLAAVVLTATAQSQLAQRLGTVEPGGRAGAGSQQVRITDPAGLRPIHTSLGEIDVDLTGLHLDHDRTLDLRSGLGTITVRLPGALDVDVRCTTTLGETTCPAGRDTGGDGPGGPVLTIDARTSLGEVEITR